MPNLNRIRTKYGWVRAVANRIGAGAFSRLFLMFNGIANLLTDPVGLNVSYQVPIVLNGRRYKWPFINILDYGLAYELWVNPSYAIDHPRPSSVRNIIDIGTNNGMSALYFRSRFPDATIHCVEPNPACVAHIHRQSDVIENICVHQKVMADSNETKEFFIDTTSSVSSSLLRRNRRQQSHQIPSTRLNTLIDNVQGMHADIVKFDIEGSEGLVFTDGVDYTRINTLVGELHYDLCDASAIKAQFVANYPYVYELDLAKNRSLVLATTDPDIRFIGG
jgi:FkbM family methyltransferase